MTRRERQRQATLDEIKDTARRQVADLGAASLSLRGVAREMGMTASALYRYIASRDDLLTALIIDGFSSLAVTLREAFDAAPAGAEGKWMAVSAAHRQWALDHLGEYGLIYGTPVPGYDAPEDTRQALFGMAEVLFDVMRTCLDEGLIPRDLELPDVPAPLLAGMQDWVNTGEVDLPAPVLAGCMVAWTAMQGAITLEAFGHYPPEIAGADLFTFQMRTVFTGLMWLATAQSEHVESSGSEQP
jgi:AcrR family transcriptional regulator